MIPQDGAPLTPAEVEAVAALIDTVPDPRCINAATSGGATCSALATQALVMDCGHEVPLCGYHGQALAAAISRGFVLSCSNAGHTPRLKVTEAKWVAL